MKISNILFQYQIYGLCVTLGLVLFTDIKQICLKHKVT